MKNKALQLMIYLIIIKSAEIRTADPEYGLDIEQTKLSIANTKRLAKELGKKMICQIGLELLIKFHHRY